MRYVQRVTVQFRLVAAGGSRSSDVMRQGQQAVARLWSRLLGTGALCFCCLLFLVPLLTAASHHDHGKRPLHLMREGTAVLHVRVCVCVCV